MLRAFDGRGFKVGVFFFFRSFFVCSSIFIFIFQGEFAVPPGFHGTDVRFYFPESFVLFHFFTIVTGCSFTFFIYLFFGVHRANISITPFVKSFSESFLNFVLTLNATMKWDPSDVTPTWDLWNDGNTEMLFNVTEAGDPDIRSVRTSDALLGRCE